MRSRSTFPQWVFWAGFVTVVAGGCRGERTEEAAELAAGARFGGQAVVCAVADVESLNPFVSPDQAAVDLRLLLFTPLVLYDDAGGFRPYLATEWSWDDDQQRLSLRIRGDVYWHDGTLLTAEDVAWTLRTAANPEYAYWGGADFFTVEEVVVRDSVALEVRFSEPLIAGLEPFVILPILPRHLLDDLSPEEFAHAQYHRSPIGSGPYRFVGRRSDGTLDFERAEPFPTELGQTYLDRIVVRAIPEPTTLIAELETGGVDACVTSAGLAERMQGSGRLTVLPLDPPGIQVVFLNTGHAPLDHPQVRRALSAALHRSSIADVVSPLARPAGTLLPPGSPWLDSDLAQPDAESDLAASLLEEAGWSLDADGVRRNAEGSALRFSLLAPSQLETALTVMQAQLRDLGVVVDLRFMEWASYVGLIQDPDSRPDAMALGLYAEKIVYPYGEVYAVLHSTGYSNLSSYSDPAVDSLVERLHAILTREERKRIYDELQRRVAEDVPAIYTVYVPRLLAVGQRLEGVGVDLNGPFASVAGWWIPTDERR